MYEERQSSPSPQGDAVAELPEFEDLARRAIRLGFTVHLTHYRFHPAHTAKYPDDCQSCVQLSIIPILDEPTSRLPWRNQECKGQSIVAVLEQGRAFLDKYESGEDLGLAAPPRKRQKLTDEKEQLRRQRIRDHWANKREEAAKETTADV